MSADGRFGKWMRVLLAVVTAALAVIYLWPKGKLDDKPRTSSSAAVSASTRAHAPWRRVHVGGGARTPIELSDARSEPAEGVGALSGQVLSAADGQPVPGAELSFSAGALHTTKTDADGKFSFQPPRAGIYELSLVVAPGYLPFAPEWGHTPLVFAAEEGHALAGARVYLTPEVRYRVHVQTEGGDPVEDAVVRSLEGAAEGAALVDKTAPEHTDADGNARVIASDGAILEAVAKGYQPGRAVLDIAAQIRGSLTIVLLEGSAAPGLTISGRVLDPDGQPAADAVIGARFLAKNPASPEARLIADGRALADEKGIFSIEDLEPGLWELVASAPGLASATVRAQAGAEDVVLRLSRGAALFGRVTDAASGEPLPAFSVIVSRTEGVAPEVVHVESTFSPDGRYEIAALPSGDYRVTAKAHGHALSAPRDVHITEGKDEEASFALGRGGRVLGKVVDGESGAPIEGARCSAEGFLADATAIPLSATARTDAEGRFEIAGLSPGVSSIFVAAEGHHARVIGGIELVEGETRGIEVALTPLADGEEPRIELAGIGAVLAAKDDALIIGKVVDGGGAAEVGLAPDDAIIAVDGIGVVELGFTTAIERIRGPEGTSVLLRIRRTDQEPFEIWVPRRRIRA